MATLISVIIPVYKVEEYLDICVESVRNQTYTNLEIILVDDGSPDGCPQMCDKWASKDMRIKVIHKTNGGLSDARNAGIDVATGDYISFVDSDDYIAPEMLQKLYEGIIHHKSDIEACKIYNLQNDIITEYDVEGNIIKDKEEKLTGLQYLKYYIGGYIENASWNKLYKKECFETIRFKKGRNNEDFLMFYEMCQNIQTIGFVDYFGYYYRQRAGSIVHDPNKFLYYDIIKNIEEIKEDIYLRNLNLKEDIDRKEIQERIVFLKAVLTRHKCTDNFNEFLKNYFFLLSTPFSYRRILGKNYRKSFLILKICPILYWFKS